MWWLPLLAPIVGGTTDDVDIQVVAIAKLGAPVLCSGTMVSERVVLTAAHCAVQDDPNAYYVMTGTRAEPVMEILDARAHPAWLGTEVNDVAVLLAVRYQVPPVRLGTGVPATVRIVGYGETNSALISGYRREGTANVTSSTSDALVLGPGPSLPCRGDSGGAVFAPTGELIGVISRGDVGCTMYAKAARVDANRTFIDAYISATAPGSAALGARCFYDEQCTTDNCFASDDPLVSYCSQACTRDDECAAGMDCDERRCIYAGAAPGALGAPCAADAECFHGTCESVGYCTVRCVSADSDCPEGYTCEHAGGIDFFCAPPVDGGGCCDAGGGGTGSSLLALWVALVLSTGRRCSSRCR